MDTLSKKMNTMYFNILNNVWQALVNTKYSDKCEILNTHIGYFVDEYYMYTVESKAEIIDLLNELEGEFPELLSNWHTIRDDFDKYMIKNHYQHMIAVRLIIMKENPQVLSKYDELLASVDNSDEDSKALQLFLVEMISLIKPKMTTVQKEEFDKIKADSNITS